MRTRSHFENAPSDEVFRRVQQLDFHSQTTTGFPPPAHDPFFTPLFIAAGVTGSFAVGGATISIASVLSAITVTGISKGVQFT